MRRPAFPAALFGATALLAAAVWPAIAAAAETAAAGPTIVFIFPAGGQCGQTVTALVAGEKIADATGGHVSGSGVTATLVAPPAEATTGTAAASGTATAPGTPAAPAAPKPDKKPKKKGRDPGEPKPWYDPERAADTVKISLVIAKDAAPGERDLRLVTPAGISTRCRFQIGDLPELAATAANDQFAKATAVAALPTVINGQLYSGWTGPTGTPDRAYYRFQAKAGQALVCDLQGRRLLPYINQAVPGWLDACLTLYDADGKRLAYADDFRFDPDPVLVYTPAKDGELVLEVRDVIYRSAQEFIYRLRLGAVPFASHLFPLGGRRGTTAAVAVQGVNLPTNQLKVPIPKDAPELLPVRVAAPTAHANALPFAAGDGEEIAEQEPNNDPAKANRAKLPITINGRIGEPGDEDYFVFRAAANQRLAFAVDARRLASPLDATLALFAAEAAPAPGPELAANDDAAAPQAVPAIAQTDTSAGVDPRIGLVTHAADPRLVYTFTKEGDYLVRIRDLREQGGDAFAYRLTVAPATPDFVLRVSPDTMRLSPGDSALLTVSALRKDDCKDEIRLAVEGLPPGFTASRASIPAGQDEALLTVTAPAGAASGFHAPTVVGTATVGGQPVVRRAYPVERVIQAFYIHHQVPTEGCVLQVAEEQYFTLATDAPAAEPLPIPAGGNGQVVVTAVRQAVAKGAIQLTAAPKSQDFSLKLAPIAADQTTATITISPGKKLAVGETRTVVLTGALRVGKDNISRVAPAITFRIAEAQPPANQPPKPTPTPTPPPPPQQATPPAGQPPKPTPTPTPTPPPQQATPPAGQPPKPTPTPTPPPPAKPA